VTAPPANTTYRVYYYAGGKPIAMREMPANDATGTLYYLHSDHLGSTSVTTNASGGVVARQWYYPYGAVRGSSGTLPTQRTFTGQYAHDPALGSLMYFNARYMSPALGRFVSADSIVPGAGNPQALNRYAFVLNNPVRYTDPTGHCAFATNGLYFDATACMGFVQRAYDSVMAGETRPEVIAMHLTGATDALLGAADYIGSLNTDINVVFSQASLEERLPHAVHLGINATLIAETIVGTAQMANAAIGARGAVTNAPDPSKIKNPNQFHYDLENGGPGQLRAQYPKTEFEFTPLGAKGADVRVVGGQHPSAYPNSTWAAGVDVGDFKPNTSSGYNRFNREISSGKLPYPSQALPYDRDTYRLLPQHHFGPR
jgi:RHS repeat-associated protein